MPARNGNGVDFGLQATAASVGAVAVLCGAIAVASWRAVVRTGNRRIQLVVAAFTILTAKNLVKAIRLASGEGEGPVFELAFSLADLTAVGLIAWPLFMPRRA